MPCFRSDWRNKQDARLPDNIQIQIQMQIQIQITIQTLDTHTNTDTKGWSEPGVPNI